jgi:hypothetical protein
VEVALGVLVGAGVRVAAGVSDAGGVEAICVAVSMSALSVTICWVCAIPVAIAASLEPKGRAQEEKDIDNIVEIKTIHPIFLITIPFAHPYQVDQRLTQCDYQ